MLNGYTANQDSVAEIKERAKGYARSSAKGVSPTTLMKVAHNLAEEGRRAEDSGELRKALEAFTRSSTLIQLLLTSQEFKNGGQGPLYREVNNWMTAHGKDIMSSTTSVESKLKDLENSANASTPSQSIANRIASLQNAGLSLASTSNKRVSRELPSVPSPHPLPTPPTSSTSSTHRLSLQTSLPPPQSPSISAPTPHAFVPTSSFGPPSPSSSASSSPRSTNQFGAGSVSEFTQNFPTIDELEEMGGLRLADTGDSIDSVHLPPPLDYPEPPLPITIPKPFPAIPFDISQRPSSTPIPTSIDTLISRPGSPARSPLSPSVPRKPSILSLNSSAQRSPFLPSTTMSTPGSSPRPDRAELPKLPKSTVTNPKDLHEYMQIGFKVLLLDVRSRDDFDKEHIKADAVVCLEPIILLRDNVNGDSIEDSLHVAPRHERTLFTNREKFDLIVIYDDAAETYVAASPVSALFEAIYEKAFKKNLRHAPMLLVGGLQAWKRTYGDAGLVHGGVPVDADPSALPRITSPTTYARSRSGTSSLANGVETAYGSSPPLDTVAGPSRAPELVDLPAPRLVRKPSLPKPPSLPRNDSAYPTNGSPSIQYPAYPRNSPAMSPPIPSLSSSSSRVPDLLSLPPTASINPYPLSRRRSDYPDQTQDAMSSYNARPIDYPDLSSAHVLRPPPAAASSALERQDNRPRIIQHGHSFSTSALSGPKPPTIQSDYPVTYWSDTQIGISGLKNLGNTCYMNSTIQCLSATVPFARFFTDGRWKSAVNMMNPLGTKGNLAHAFASILHEMWQAEMPYLSPLHFRRSICSHASQFAGSDQHDSQEFLSFLLDGLHEDLNRILHKPTVQISPEREAELERLPPHIASDQEWEIYRTRNDSLIVDFFQGQFRNRLECLTCGKTSTTYNAFMYLSLPIPTPGRGSKVSIQACLDALVNKEVMEKSEAWNCPNCKALRRATKQLSLSRLPPILLINLKRFSFKGPFTDKIEAFVEFPLKALDLTSYMPALDTRFGAMGVNGSGSSGDDPRAQVPPFTYDLYAVTNHFGSLSSGHYTSFVASRGGWMYCDDSKVTPVDAKEVVGKPAYVLFYKRTKA